MILKIGNIQKNIVPIIKLIEVVKNFVFNFQDFIKHPIARKIRESINKITKSIKIILNVKNKIFDVIFSKLFI